MSAFDPEWMSEVTGGRWTKRPDYPIETVVNDSRQVAGNALYIAMRGERFDGHNFVRDALDAGAAAAMVEYTGMLSLRDDMPLLVVDDTQAALCAMASDYRRRIAPLVIGVTGSMGKSTVKEMTACVLSQAGETGRTRGNWNNQIGLPLSLLAMRRGSRYGVYEIGMNHPGEIQPLCDVLKPDWGMVTMIGPVHLEHFESEEGIAREKGELLRALPPNGHAFLCRDDKWFPLLKSLTPCALHTVSLATGDADLQVSYDPGEKRLRLHVPESGETQQMIWPWAGNHNALNAGFAVLAGRQLGLSWSQIMDGLEQYKPLPMRWQEIHHRGCVLINDAYNANPDSMRAAIETFTSVACDGRRWLVLGDMLEIGHTEQDVHERLGAGLVELGDWDGLLTVGRLAGGIARGAREAGMDSDRVWCCEDTDTAAMILREQIQSGDAVLFKASRGIALEKIIAGLRVEQASSGRGHQI